jgi:SAM-dependent methyltransferase
VDVAPFVEELFPQGHDEGFQLSNHQFMLEDRRRIGAFRDAIRAQLEPGDVVIDAGCGTGILGFLAAQCGAKRVVGVDIGPVIGPAAEIAASLAGDARVEFVRGDVLAGRLPALRADLAVCELLGPFGIDEGIVRAARHLRRKVLKRSGRMIPERLELFVAPVSSPDIYADLAFWRRRRFGIDFSPFQEVAYDRSYAVSRMDATRLARPGRLVELELGREDLPSAPRLEFVATRGGTLHGFLGWFRAHLGAGITLANHPDRDRNHWQQAFFPVGEPLRLRRSDRVHFQLHFGRSPDQGAWTWSGRVESASGRVREFRRGATAARKRRGHST